MHGWSPTFTWTHLAPLLRSTVSVTRLLASLVGVIAQVAFTPAPSRTTFPVRPLSRSVIRGLEVSMETVALVSGPTLPGMSVARQADERRALGGDGHRAPLGPGAVTELVLDEVDA